MATIKKGDFIELDYTGTVDGGKVFDTTIAAVAAKEKLNARAGFKPVIICVGEGHLLPGIDVHLEGKALPGKHTIELKTEAAFGKKDAKLLKLIPLKKFHDSKIEPFIGLDLNIDGNYGIVRSISGGRVTVDFNHPLAGKDVTYELDVKRLVEKADEKVSALFEMIGLHHHGIALEGNDHLVIKIHSQLPPPVMETINGIVTRLVPAIKNVTYHVDAAGHDHGEHGHDGHEGHEHVHEAPKPKKK